MGTASDFVSITNPSLFPVLVVCVTVVGEFLKPGSDSRTNALLKFRELLFRIPADRRGRNGSRDD